MNFRAGLDLRRSWRPGHAPALAVIPVGLIVAVCVVDTLLPEHIHLGPLLVAAPAITVAFAGARMTALMGGLAVAAQVLIGTVRGGLTSANIQAQIAALIVVSAICVFICVVRDRSERQLDRVRSVAAVAQGVLLQPLPTHAGPLRIAGMYIPAEEEADLGGDLYAAARTAHGSTRLLIGDVRGHGLAAINNSALLLGAFRAAAHRQATLPQLAVHLDAAFRWDANQWRSHEDHDANEDFATATLLDIPDHEPVVHVITCGHPPPLRLHGTHLTPSPPTRATSRSDSAEPSASPPTRSRPSPSRPGISCCSTQTASSKPATPPDTSTPSPKEPRGGPETNRTSCCVISETICGHTFTSTSTTMPPSSRSVARQADQRSTRASARPCCVTSGSCTVGRATRDGRTVGCRRPGAASLWPPWPERRVCRTRPGTPGSAHRSRRER